MNLLSRWLGWSLKISYNDKIAERVSKEETVIVLRDKYLDLLSLKQKLDKSGLILWHSIMQHPYTVLECNFKVFVTNLWEIFLKIRDLELKLDKLTCNLLNEFSFRCKYDDWLLVWLLLHDYWDWSDHLWSSNLIVVMVKSFWEDVKLNRSNWWTEIEDWVSTYPFCDCAVIGYWGTKGNESYRRF